MLYFYKGVIKLTSLIYSIAGSRNHSPKGFILPFGVGLVLTLGDHVFLVIRPGVGLVFWLVYISYFRLTRPLGLWGVCYTHIYLPVVY